MDGNVVTTMKIIQPPKVLLGPSRQPLLIVGRSKRARIKENSDFVRGTGFTLSLLSTILTYIAVQKQYNNGGVSNVNAVDFTGLVLGTSGLTTAGLKQSGLSNFPSC